MGNRTKDQILQDITSSTNNRRQRVRDKRAKRGTLADRMHQFEMAWGDGQREAMGGSGIPTRINSRGRALVKQQILNRVEGDFDTKAFAAWCAKHWNAIGAQYFAKAKSYPEHPVIPWLITCLETYLTAFEQREYLDEDGKRSETDTLRKAKQADAAIDYSEQVAKAAQQRIAQLEAEVRERDQMLDDYESGGKVHKKKKYTIGDFDAPEKPKRRRLRK